MDPFHCYKVMLLGTNYSNLAPLAYSYASNAQTGALGVIYIRASTEHISCEILKHYDLSYNITIDIDKISISPRDACTAFNLLK